MHIATFLYIACMHSRQKFSGIFRRFVLTAFLTSSISSKRISLMISLSLGKRKSHRESCKWNRFVSPPRLCSFVEGSIRNPGHGVYARCKGKGITTSPATTLASYALKEENVAVHFVHLWLCSLLLIDEKHMT